MDTKNIYEEVEALKDSLKSDAIDTALKTFALKALEVDGLMADNSQYQIKSSDIAVDINIPLPDLIAKCVDSDNGGEPAAKRIKLSATTLDPKKSVLFPSGVVHCNPVCQQLVSIVRPQIAELSSNIVSLKSGILLMIPRIEDGNNFGVEVQREVLELISSIDDEMHERLNVIHNYYAKRAELVAKIVENSYSEDYRSAVGHRDRNFHNFLRTSLALVRNYYLIVHDMVAKNANRIRKPKSGSNEGCLY